jgi:hypothetical protein
MKPMAFGLISGALMKTLYRPYFNQTAKIGIADD